MEDSQDRLTYCQEHADNEEEKKDNRNSSVVRTFGGTSARGKSASYAAMAINRCIILEGTEDEMICRGFRETTFRTVLFYFTVLITAGLILLIFYWKPEWKIRLKSIPCDIESTTNVILYDRYQRKHVKQIRQLSLTKDSLNRGINDSTSQGGLERRAQNASKPYISLSRITKHGLQQTLFFEYKFQKFLWNGETFLPLRGFDVDTTIHELQEMTGGLCEAEKTLRRNLFGLNSIAVEITPMFTLLFREILHPFYIFQVFAIIVWCADEYYSLPAVIVLSSSITITLSLYLTRKQNQMIHNMSSGSGPVRVLINGNFETRQSTELLPGDVIEIESKQKTLWCDCVILTGCCVVSESMLTGESVPVLKSALESGDATYEYYDNNSHKHHMLYGGTKVVDVYPHQGNEPPRAVVIRTGFYTEKGKMIESMLSPSPLDYKYYNDSLMFILIMAIIGMFGCAITIAFLARLGVDAGLVVKRVLDLLTIIVPPGLPAAMTIATIYAQRRLRNAQIFCISPPRIAISGKINCMCFDKTGTLTENELKLWGIVPCSDEQGDTAARQKPHFQEPAHDGLRLPKQGGIGLDCFRAIASCHSLVNVNGQITGDPIDLELFNATQWNLTRSDDDWCKGCNMAFSASEDDEVKLAVAKVYQFNSGMRRMSVITKVRDDDRLHVYVKGAPETIVNQCKQLTVPDDFEQKLLSYTQQGYRVLALATKTLEADANVDDLERSFVESELQFLGLVVLKNPLRPGTTDTIMKLNAANIRNVMATGDNLETAIHVAMECKMIAPSDSIVIVKADTSSSTKRWEPLDVGDDRAQVSTETSFCSMMPIIENPTMPACHLAMSGDTLELIRTHSKDLFNRVLMSATVLARMNPEHKRHLVEGLQETKEGRAALVTSFGMMKFLCIYCFVQYLSLIILYSINSYLSDIQFLFSDLGVTSLVTFFFAIGRASTVLYPKLPHLSIVSPIMITCLLLQIFALVLIQIASFLTLQNQSWHTPLQPNMTHPKENIICNENTVMFYTSCFQDMMLAFIFYEALPHKEAIYKNVPYFVGFAIISVWVLIMFFAPVEPILTAFSLTTLNYDVGFRFILFSYYVINIVFGVFVEAWCTRGILNTYATVHHGHEKFLLQSKSFERFLNKARNKYSRMRSSEVTEETEEPVHFYDLRCQLAQDAAWPPVGQKTSIRI